ncbi:hypothetical protein FACS1894211_08270 [Clostridia bacterium]|nr:hypothetical protein FACS1894211_08270 [Clostridia bacterium]
MNVKLKRNLRVWTGLSLLIIGIAAISAAYLIIGKYGGPGINLNKTNPRAVSLSWFHTGIGLGLLLFGAMRGIFGFINRSVYSVCVDHKKVKRIGAIRLAEKQSAALDCDAIKNNLMQCGYSKLKESVYFYIAKNIATVIIFNDGIWEGGDLKAVLPEYIAAMKKTEYFSGVSVLYLNFKNGVDGNDILLLSDYTKNMLFAADNGICLLFGIIDLNTNILYTDSNIYIRNINFNLSGFYTGKMIRHLTGETKKAPVKRAAVSKTIPEKNQYKLSTFKAVFVMFLISSLAGLWLCAFAGGAFISGQTEAGEALISMGVVLLLGFGIPALLMKRSVIASKRTITEKRLLRKPFTIDCAKAKWYIVGSFTGNGIAATIAITSDYVFAENELVTYKNAKGRYIIVKSNETNISILKKAIGEETKV